MGAVSQITIILRKRGKGWERVLVALSIVNISYRESAADNNPQIKMPTLTKLYTIQEASQHNTRDDCWIVVNNKVTTLTFSFL